MKIGIDITQAQYQGTGVGSYTLNLVKELVSLNSEHEFVLFGSSLRGYKNLKSLMSSVSVPKRILPLPPTLLEYLFNQQHKLPIETIVGKVDIFHASDWVQPPARKARMVTTIHDLTVLKFPEHQHPQIIETHKRRLELVKKSQVSIIADSHVTKLDIVKLLKIPDDRITVVHLAASHDFSVYANLSRPEKTKRVTAIKKKYGLDQYVLSVGTSEPRKNLDRVVESFERINTEQYQSLQLAIAGKYGWGDRLEAKPENPNIKLLGFVDQADLPALYAGAKSFVYPSLYEGFGLPVLEAMTVGTPVVTSKKGSLAEVVGEAAVVVNPASVQSIANGLVEVLTQRKEYRSRGLKQAKKFSWRKTAEETMAVYERLVEKG